MVVFRTGSLGSWPWNYQRFRLFCPNISGREHQGVGTPVVHSCRDRPLYPHKRTFELRAGCDANSLGGVDNEKLWECGRVTTDVLRMEKRVTEGRWNVGAEVRISYRERVTQEPTKKGQRRALINDNAGHSPQMKRDAYPLR